MMKINLYTNQFTSADTGCLGRGLDVLANKMVPGSSSPYRVGGISIDSPSVLVNGVPGESPDSFIVSNSGPELFNPGADADSANDITSLVQKINNATSFNSTFFGEMWSSGLLTAVQEAKVIKTLLDLAPLNVQAAGDEKWDKMVSMLCRMIQTKVGRKSDRDALYLEFGGKWFSLC